MPFLVFCEEYLVLNQRHDEFLGQVFATLKLKSGDGDGFSAFIQSDLISSCLPYGNSPLLAFLPEK